MNYVLFRFLETRDKMDKVFIGLLFATIVCICLKAYNDIFQTGVSIAILAIFVMRRFIVSEITKKYFTGILSQDDAEKITTQALCIVIPLVQLVLSPTKSAIILVCLLIGYSFHMKYLNYQFFIGCFYKATFGICRRFKFDTYKTEPIYCFATVLNIVGVVMSFMAVRQFCDILLNSITMIIRVCTNTHDLHCLLYVGQSIIAFDWLFIYVAKQFPSHQKEIKILRILLSYVIFDMLTSFGGKIEDMTIENWRVFLFYVINVVRSYYLDPVRAFKELQWKEIMPKFYQWCLKLLVNTIDTHIIDNPSLPESIKMLWYYLCGKTTEGEIPTGNTPATDFGDVLLEMPVESEKYKLIQTELSKWWNEPSNINLIDESVSNGKRINELLNSYNKCQEFWIITTPKVQTLFLYFSRVYILFFVFTNIKFFTFEHFDHRHFIIVSVVVICLDYFIRCIISALYVNTFVCPFKDELKICNSGISAMVKTLELIQRGKFVLKEEKSLFTSLYKFVSMLYKYKKNKA